MIYNYTFRIKKGKFELEVTSENKYFILMQYEKLLKDFTPNLKKAEKAKKEAATKQPELEIKQEKLKEAIEQPKQGLPVSEKPAEKADTVELKAKEEAESVKQTAELAIPEPEVSVEVEPEPEQTEETEPEPVDAVEETELQVEETEIAQIQAEETEDLPKEIAEEEVVVAQTQPEEEVEEAKIEENPVEEEPGTEQAQQEPAIKKVKADDEIERFLYKRNFDRDEKSAVDDSSEEQESDFDAIFKEKLGETSEISADEEEKELAEELRKSFEEKEKEQISSSKEVEPETNNKKAKVYDILQEKLSSIPEADKNRLNLSRNITKEEPKSLKFKSLEDLIYLKKPQTKLDYLLITSYYLLEKESEEKYSLKQINSVIIPQIKEPIDHSVIHEAVAHEYFEVVPDYLGTAGITEYKITDEGIDYILNEL